MDTSIQNSTGASQQFLTFLLEDHEYALEIFRIREIRGYSPITPIPNVPAHVRGVMNLRGTVLPVIDLRMKFHLPPIEYNKFTVIMIAAVGKKMVGLLVDAVSDVLMVQPDSIRETPDFGQAVDTRFVNGIIESKEKLAVVLDLDQLLSDGEVLLANEVSGLA